MQHERLEVISVDPQNLLVTVDMDPQPGPEDDEMILAKDLPAEPKLTQRNLTIIAPIEINSKRDQLKTVLHEDHHLKKITY